MIGAISDFLRFRLLGRKTVSRVGRYRIVKMSLGVERTAPSDPEAIEVRHTRLLNAPRSSERQTNLNMSVKEAALRAGVSDSTIYRWIKEGKLEAESEKPFVISEKSLDKCLSHRKLAEAQD